ncbi:hypothetical protein F4775DRAFT_591684 [Biscogniauxia sp. FL1348]|nr:hypothetical protein F4775DRAFT_591684 [Biscogniauxia sp. FL1348]
MPPHQQLAPVVSAETPVVSDLTRELVEAIYRDDSYEALVVIVQRMALDFRRFDNVISVRKCRGVAAQLEKYRLACATWVGKNLDDDYGQSQLSQSEQEALTLAMEVDNQYLEENKVWTESQRFSRAPSRTSLTSCYVGCSKEVSGRTVNHSPDSTSLRKSSNVWGAFLSCLAHMGVRPRVCQVPVVKCWQQSHIPLAEILVTVIAGSLVLDDGFNVIQPGTSSTIEMKDQHAFEKCKEHEEQVHLEKIIDRWASMSSMEDLQSKERRAVELEQDIVGLSIELEKWNKKLENRIEIMEESDEEEGAEEEGTKDVESDEEEPHPD